jgi:hypothetical protein
MGGHRSGAGHAHDRGVGQAERGVTAGGSYGAAAFRAVLASRGVKGGHLHGWAEGRPVRAVHPRAGRGGEGLEQLADQPRSLRGGIGSIPQVCDLMEGRGAGSHPDGVTRFVRTALRVIEGHAQHHPQRGPCHGGSRPFLPLPAERRSVRSRGR